MKILRLSLIVLLTALRPWSSAAEPPPEANPWHGEEILPAGFAERGEERFGVGDYDRAIMYWDQARKRDPALKDKIVPRLAEAYLRRGIDRFNGGDCPRASADLSEALKLRPGSKNIQVAWQLVEEARIKQKLQPVPNPPAGPPGTPADLDREARYTKAPLDTIQSSGAALPPVLAPIPRRYPGQILMIDLVDPLMLVLIVLVTRRARWFTKLSLAGKAAFFLGVLLIGFPMKGFLFFLFLAVALLRAWEMLSPPSAPGRGT